MENFRTNNCLFCKKLPNSNKYLKKNKKFKQKKWKNVALNQNFLLNIREILILEQKKEIILTRKELTLIRIKMII